MTTAKALPRAATVLVLRAAPASPAPASVGDVEVLLVQRNSRASFMAGAYVFPGGRVDPADLEAAAKSATASESVPLRAARHAAARELEEEVGLVISDLSQLQRFAHWITPSAEPKRFDTEFFTFALFPQPDGQLPSLSITGTEVAKNAEVGAPLWLSPQAALQRYLQGQLNLPPPTACTLEELAAELELVKAQNQDCTAPELLARLMQQTAARVPLPAMPKFLAPQADQLAIVMPWDPDFPSLPGEGEPLQALASGAAPLAARIRQCRLRLPTEGSASSPGPAYAITPPPSGAAAGVAAAVSWTVLRA